MSARAYRNLFWIGALLALIVALGMLQGILMPFAASLVIAYVLAPVVGRLERVGLPRSLSSLAVLAVFLLALGLIVVLLVPLVQQQVVLLIARAPDLARALQAWLGRLMLLLQQHLPQEEVGRVRDAIAGRIGEAITWAASLFQSMVTSSIALLNIVSLIVVTPVVTFFLLRDWSVMVASIDAHLPRASLATIREQAQIVSNMLVGFIHGQALVCLCLAVYYSFALSVAGLDSALAVGLLIGVLAIVPVVGAAIGFGLSLSLAAVQYGSWTELFVVCGIFLFGQAIEANVLTPRLVGDRIHLHPVWVIFALFAGGTLFGFIGVLVSVPAAAVIGVLVRFALARYRRSPVYDPTQATPVRGLTPYR